MAISNFYKKSIIFIKLIKESISFAFSQLNGNKFRSFLSLLGVSIGIFSIVAIFTAVDTLQNALNGAFSVYSNDMLVISKWPMGPENEDGEIEATQGEYRWWDFMKREPVTYQQYKFVQANSKLAEAIALSSSVSLLIKYKGKAIPNAWTVCISHSYTDITKNKLKLGRFYTKEEDMNASPVVVLGHDVAKTIFGDGDPLGQTIKISGRNTRVIGVFEKEDVSLFGLDRSVVVPLEFGKYFLNLERADNYIYVKPKGGVNFQEIKGELVQLLRSCRRLKPGEKNDFSISSVSFLQDMVDNVFKVINLVGWVIASFSLLIGGFGIANIMFVSVKERTNIIGIQKALGAKKYVILTQFLVESAVLAIAGGAVGIFLVYVIVQILNATLLVGNTFFNLELSLLNIFWGLFISSIIGLLSGVIPAMSAASLNPVDAINSK